MTAPRIEDVLPLTPVQEGLLFHSSLEDGQDVYNVQLALDLDGPLDHERLRGAAQRLVDRNPALRSSFRQRPGGAPVRVVQSEAKAEWTYHDGGDAEDLAQADLARRFTPAAAPLIRFTLIKMAPGRHRLLVTNHHVLLDGWSTPLLLRELLGLHLGLPLPPVTPVKPYFEWRATRDLAAAREAWRTALAELEQPTRLVPGTGESAPRRQVHLVPEELTAAVSAQARRTGLTLNTVVQTAWGLLLARLTNSADVVFGATTAGRPAEVPGAESMIGMFIDTVPVRVRVRTTESLSELGARLQREQTALTPHHHVGLTGIQAEAPVGGDLFDTLVVFENYPLDASDDGSEVRITGMDTTNHTHYPVTLMVIPGDALTLHLGHRPDVVSDEQADRLVRQFTRLLSAFAENPDARACTVDLLDPVERQQVAVDWNDTAKQVPETGVAEMFAAHAAAAAGKTALRFRDEALTYAELDRRAEDLADVVRSRGIGREDLVALAVPRSAEMVVSLLAVLKSGAAYLPIDPEYPADRIDFMLGDADAALLITTGEVARRLPSGRTPLVLVQSSAPSSEVELTR